MRKIFLVLLVLTSTIFGVHAQDVITKKDGSEILAKVVEIDNSVVKYKLYDNQDGPTYVVNKSELFMIKYESGRKELFNSSANAPTTSSTTTPVTRATPPVQNRTPVTASSFKGDWAAQMQAQTPDIYKRYKRGSRQTGVGIGLLAGGTAAIIVGYGIIGSTVVSDDTIGEDEMGTAGVGALVAVAGSICATVGTPIMIVGLVKKGKAKREFFRQYTNRTYNQKSPLQSPHLEINMNGLAFKF
jgi:hypothetical protein